MLIWILAVLLFISFGIIGFYQGALRVAVSLVGVITAALLALPLSGAFKWVLGIFGLEHPVLLAFIAPLAAFCTILIAFTAGGLAAHKQLDTYYKYKASDTIRMLFDRMNSRVGICLGVLNGFVYVIVLGVVIYMFGYLAIQVRTADNDSFVMKTMAKLAEDLRETKLDKAVAAFVPKAEKYFDGVDIVSVIFRTPLLQNRLSTYPVFLTLNEKPEFKQIGASTEVQDFWVKGPTIQEFRSHQFITPLVENKAIYTDIDAMLGGDYKDLKTYLETGKSPKYDDELILGRWDFNGRQSFALAMKRTPNAPLAVQRRIRTVLGTIFRESTVTATVDNKIIFKMPRAANARATLNGTWAKGAGSYALEIVQEGSTLKADALVEGNRMTFAKDGYGLVFEK